MPVFSPKIKEAIEIFGVETEGADAVTQSFRLNKLVRLSAITSIAKTLGAKQTTETTFSRIKAVVNDMQTVTDQEALDALKFMLTKEKILIEPAASCIIAALMKNKFDLSNVEKLGIVLCGANVSLQELKEWKIEFQKWAALPWWKRIFTNPPNAPEDSQTPHNAPNNGNV